MFTYYLQFPKYLIMFSLQKLNLQAKANSKTSSNFALYKTSKMNHKSLVLLFVFVLGTSFQNGLAQPTESRTSQGTLPLAELAEQVIEAIQKDDYRFVEKIFRSGQLNVNGLHNGKTYLMYASIYNKPEMIRLLYTLGADLLKRCDEGYLAADHAKQHQAYKARAELIVLQA